MVRITLKYFGKVTTATGKNMETIEIPNNVRTLRDLFYYLEEIYGKKFGEIVLKNDGLADDIIVLVNHKSVGNNLNVLLKNGDTISILPFVSGG